MIESQFEVRMLGSFSIRYQGKEINDSDNRSKKIWLLLACLIYCRRRALSNEELMVLLWGNEARQNQPINALKTMFHRLRAMLNQLGDGMGHQLIIRRNGTYTWNPQAKILFDVEEFDSRCREGNQEADPLLRLTKLQNALSWYQGDFLSKLGTESWVVPISSYFHDQYLETVQAVLALQEEHGYHEGAVSLCHSALELEPYNEPLYQHLMQNYMHLGENQQAVLAYEEMRDRLFSAFGILPSPESTALYRKAGRTKNGYALNMERLQEQLREPDQLPGALFCDYDFFRIICHAEARTIVRSGDAVHLGLLSVTDDKGEPLARRSLDCCMENLKDLIRRSLRKGDIAARCSLSQFSILLPLANYENSCMVMSRIVSAFGRQYPHSPARLQFLVQPLEASL